MNLKRKTNKNHYDNVFALQRLFFFKKSSLYNTSLACRFLKERNNAFYLANMRY